MTALTLDLPPDLYARLRAEAERQGKPLEGIAQEWLAAHRPTPPATSARSRARAALRGAGLLVEPTPEQLAWAETVDVTLEEVSAALDRAAGKPLSEIVTEMRGPKE